MEARWWRAGAARRVAHATFHGRFAARARGLRTVTPHTSSPASPESAMMCAGHCDKVPCATAPALRSAAPHSRATAHAAGHDAIGHPMYAASPASLASVQGKGSFRGCARVCASRVQAGPWVADGSSGGGGGGGGICKAQEPPDPAIGARSTRPSSWGAASYLAERGTGSGTARAPPDRPVPGSRTLG